MKLLKCIIIDDEPLAVKLLETFVQQTPFTELVGVCDNALEGMELLANSAVDLLFLDSLSLNHL